MTLTINVLAAAVLSAMQAWVPESRHVGQESSEAVHARYVEIAKDIATVTLDPKVQPLPDQDRRSTAIHIAAVGYKESEYRQDVDACRKSGDNGHAWSMWQMHQNRKLVCGNRQKAIRIALEMMRYSFDKCAHSPIEQKLSVYTDGFAYVKGNGRCNSPPDRSKSHVAPALEWLHEHPVEEILNEQELDRWSDIEARSTPQGTSRPGRGQNPCEETGEGGARWRKARKARSSCRDS